MGDIEQFVNNLFVFFPFVFKLFPRDTYMLYKVFIKFEFRNPKGSRKKYIFNGQEIKRGGGVGGKGPAIKEKIRFLFTSFLI